MRSSSSSGKPRGSSVNCSSDQPPSTAIHSPGLVGAHPLGQHLQRLLARGDAVEAQLVVLGGAHPVGVVVDQARDHGAPIEIDDPGLRPFQLLRCRRSLPTATIAPAADRQRLRDA